MNRKKAAGLEDTKTVYVEKLLKQYYEPGTGTYSHQPYSIMRFILELRYVTSKYINSNLITN